MEKVAKQMPTCGHVNELACSDDVHSVLCSTPCGAILACGDPCSGTCGQCRRGRLHKKCDADCKRILLCGHECKEKCSKACPPCQNQCENRCVHSWCNVPNYEKKYKGGRTCGDPCPPCVEPCTWNCDHHKCNLHCYEPCQRERCMEKCEKKLECGHDCIGVCGETCPQLCRQCDKQKYEELLEQQDRLVPIDEEKKDTAMFVQLEDCKQKHLFEVSFLDTWFDEMVSQAKAKKAAEIKLLQCPLCNAKVQTTRRYGIIFKQYFLDTQQVKVKNRGDVKALEIQRNQLQHNIPTLGRKWYRCEIRAAGTALLDSVTKSAKLHLTQNRLVSLENLVQLFDHLIIFEETYERKLKRQPRLPSPSKQSAALRFIDQFFPISGNATMDNEEKLAELVKLIQREINFLMKWIVRNAESSSDQMIQEFSNECHRVMLLAGLVEILVRMTNEGEDIGRHWAQVEEIMAVFNGVNTFNVELEKSTAEKIRRLSTACGCNTGLGISEIERVEILKAIGLNQGHWFKCPNGHIYCIGDCGGAMQEGNCPECHAGIGGASHRLRSDNAVASEMDGATQSAYDDAARGDAVLARRLQEMQERG